MVFLVSTVSADVALADLGITLVHPTADRDLSLEFTASELAESVELTTNINAGSLTLKLNDTEYGSYTVDSTEYYPGLSVQNQYVRAEVEDYITEAELAAALLDTLVNTSASGLSVTSTATSTKNVYVTTGKFQKWKLSPEDKVVITGGPASGIYTIDEVADQNQFTVVESISNSAGAGVLTVYHPVGATKVGVDATGLANLSGNNLQDIVSSIDSAFTAVGGGAGLVQKAGTVASGVFTGTPKTAAVTFSTPFSDANYAITLTAQTQNNHSYSITYNTKLATGFVINVSANNISNLLAVSWIALKHGESI